MRHQDEYAESYMRPFYQFIAKFPRRVYQKGETILLKDDLPRAVHVIESGMVKVYNISAEGAEHLIAIISRHEDFPVAYTLGFMDRAPYFYEAFNRTVIRLVPRADYLQYLRSNVDVLYERHVRLAILLTSTLERVDVLEQPRAQDKVIGALFYIAEKFGSMFRPSQAKMKVSVTQQEIANLLGLSRETTNLELKKLESMKLLSHTRQSYTLYLERLQKYYDDHQ